MANNFVCDLLRYGPTLAEGANPRARVCERSELRASFAPYKSSLENIIANPHPRLVRMGVRITTHVR